MFFGYECPSCGDDDNEVEVTIESHGHPGSYWEPGEGPSWYVETDPIICASCGHITPDAEFDKRFGAQVDARVMEPNDDGYDEYAD